MTSQEKTAAGLGALLIAYLWFICRDQLPVVHVDPRSLEEDKYDPFTFWRGQHAAEWFRPYPATVGANCLPLIVQNQDIGLALSDQEVYGASNAQ